VRVEARRAMATYTVVQGGSKDAIDLIYRFEEDVFDERHASRNLAAVLCAQVALNYGLFCERIVFRGAFDAHDLAFLQEFAENTAREIYVNKFLMPNPFLIGPAAALPAIKLKRYLRAAIEIDAGPARGRKRAPAAGEAEDGRWSVDPARHAVLSSGGKDSLLTFGLLRELGLGTDPVFVNESGRHWYTALNAYRHLLGTHATTARVWTNSDRVFSWMLRHLPFVRQDFARVRADDYPIRLWTVAVFLFGALPLLRKRGIGRLLIGNEFDTTVRPTTKGIVHYGGLYDQSRHFDSAMTRYFRRKGWGICQFSVVRPLSELLIEGMLARRYPDLHEHQLSCHAAHLADGRVRPCGDCEKCRRIVGMLCAMGEDPQRCGYSAAQVEHCLRELVTRPIHQEAAGAAQMFHQLAERGLIDAAKVEGVAVRPHPEVLALRFDPERSPFDWIPADLRRGLYRIWLEHASGAVERTGRIWKPCKPTSESVLSRPYPFDPPASRRRRALPARPLVPTTYLLAEMSWPQAQARFKEVDVALLPVGSIEQHGPHLPLDTDAFDADFLARRVAAACSDPKPLVLPLIHYGVSYQHEDFSGTFSVNPELLSRLVYEIGASAARYGITKLVIVNGHGGNAPSLHLAAQMINRDAHIFTCVDTGETSDTDVYELVENPHNDVHAGEIETSTALATRPELVQMEQAPRAIPRFSSRFLDFTSKRGVGWYGRTARISRSGVMGDATKATRAKGEKIWELMTRRLVELVEDLKRLSLDEIYQRRY